jgi:hypothetical protein
MSMGALRHAASGEQGGARIDSKGYGAAGSKMTYIIVDIEKIASWAPAIPVIDRDTMPANGLSPGRPLAPANVMPAFQPSSRFSLVSRDLNLP